MNHFLFNVHTYIKQPGKINYHDDTANIIFLLLISVVAGSLVGPIPYWLIAVTMTTTVSVNTPSGSDGAVNVSVVVELLAMPHQVRAGYTSRSACHILEYHCMHCTIT